VVGLLILLTRAVSYFTKPNNEINSSLLIAKGVMMRLCCMMILASIYALLADGLLLLKIIILNMKDVMIVAC
jgi:hypothetical protein